MTNRIAVLGSSNTDMIVQLPRIPRPGETLLGGRFSTAAGGKGANQAVAAARAGGDVSFIARIGSDMFGDRALEGFQAAGIDTTHITRDEHDPSGVALICVDDDGENSIAVAPGCNGNLSSADVDAARDTIAGAEVLLMQLEVPLDTVIRAAGIASAADTTVILNPAPARELPDKLLDHVTILTPNEHEAGLLTGITVDSEQSAHEAASVLRNRGVETVLITRGADGVYVLSDACAVQVDAYRVEAVDTTAAGDVFNGVLAAGLASGMTLTEAVGFGSAAAALSVTRLGAQPSAPDRAEIASFRDRHG